MAMTRTILTIFKIICVIIKSSGSESFCIVYYSDWVMNTKSIETNPDTVWFSYYMRVSLIIRSTVEAQHIQVKMRIDPVALMLRVSENYLTIAV